MRQPVRPTCKQTATESQANNPVDRVEAALAEKSRCCRSLKMRLGAEFTDPQLAQQMGTSHEVIARWRKVDDRTSPTLVSMLLASDQVFDVLVRELCDARQRLGHGKRSIVDGDAAERAERLVAALSRAQSANSELLGVVEESRRSR
jgi:hypothetical protein